MGGGRGHAPLARLVQARPGDHGGDHPKYAGPQGRRPEEILEAFAPFGFRPYRIDNPYHPLTYLSSERSAPEPLEGAIEEETDVIRDDAVGLRRVDRGPEDRGEAYIRYAPVQAGKKLALGLLVPGRKPTEDQLHSGGTYWEPIGLLGRTGG